MIQENESGITPVAGNHGYEPQGNEYSGDPNSVADLLAEQ